MLKPICNDITLQVTITLPFMGHMTYFCWSIFSFLFFFLQNLPLIKFTEWQTKVHRLYMMGGDEITISRMHEKSYDFTSTFPKSATYKTAIYGFISTLLDVITSTVK